MNPQSPEEVFAFREAMTECSKATQKRPPLDEADFLFYFKKLEDVNTPIVVAALDALSKEQNYFPSVAKVRARAAVMVDEQRDAAWKAALANCPHPHHWEDKDGRLQRCACWTSGSAAAEAVGKRLALPPSGTTVDGTTP